MSQIEFPPFSPHPLFRGGHLQTLAGLYLPWRKPIYRAQQHRITLDDGDILVLHDDRPPQWNEGDRCVLLMHGLAGCHQSPYMVRIAEKLHELGIRAFRLDLRGCGAGAQLACQPYHAGRSDDALAALQFAAQLTPGSRLGMVGFSLSGNILLKLLGERAGDLPAALDRAMAVNPPIDLQACVQRLRFRQNRAYDRHFVKLLLRQVTSRPNGHPQAPTAQFVKPPRTLFEFDDLFTAPVGGFGDAATYYARCSSRQFLEHIQVPTLILSSRDDPLVAAEIFETQRLGGPLTVHLAESGGHLGYIGRGGHDPDRRWMDWRVLEWMTARL